MMWFIRNKVIWRIVTHAQRLKKSNLLHYHRNIWTSNNGFAKHKQLYVSIITGSVLAGGLYIYYGNDFDIFVKTNTGNSDGLPMYRMEDVAQHSTKDSRIWVSYENGVYDITEFIDKHPGADNIMMAAGAAVDPFWKTYAFHKKPEILNMLENYRIGSLIKDKNAEDTVDTDDPYSKEPIRNPLLKVNSAKPFNAEPPTPLLIKSFITPTDIFFVRNHLPVPEIDESTYELEVCGEGVSATHTFSLEDLKNKFPKKVTVTATIQCAGNQRSQMVKVKPVKGLNWDAGAIGTATWTGVLLRDVLQYCNLHEIPGAKHVQFEGLDTNPASAPYGASVPIEKVMDPSSDVILAYEMNGQPIPIDHGFPLRVIIPGVVGARNVKWLGKIIISDKESDAFWQQSDYKGFSPSIDWDTVDFKSAPAIQELPVISAICDPVDGQQVKPENGKITVQGYAWSGGGRKIIRVDFTSNGGIEWKPADIMLEDKEASLVRCWSWAIWKAEVPVSDNQNQIEIWVKAVDSSYNTQPENFEHIWNLRGVLGNAYHRIRINITPTM